MKTSEYPATPELERMHTVKEHSQVIGEFIDWLNEQGVRFGKRHVHDENCNGWDHERNRYNPGLNDGCSFQTGEFEDHELAFIGIERLLAKYFEIDLEKVDDERRAILEHLNNQKT